MELRFKRLDLTGGAGQHVPSAKLEGTASGGVIAFFHQFSGLMAVPDESLRNDKHAGLIEWYELLAADAMKIDAEQRIPFLMTRTAFFHETQHFHDCFCTPAGVKLLESYSFALALRMILIQEVIGCRATVGMTTRFPLPDLLREPGCPDALPMMADTASSLVQRLAFDVGSSPLCYLEGHDLDNDFTIAVLRDGKEGDIIEVPCVHANMLVDDQPMQEIWPLGFCLYSECLAVLTQGSHLAAVETDYRLQMREYLKEGVNPYTRLLGSLIRVFKSRGHNPSDEDIYSCVYRALFPEAALEPRVSGRGAKLLG
jgi:hypothetical protein